MARIYRNFRQLNQFKKTEQEGREIYARDSLHVRPQSASTVVLEPSQRGGGVSGVGRLGTDSVPRLWKSRLVISPYILAVTMNLEPLVVGHV